MSGTDTGNPREDKVYVITMYAVKFGYVGLRYTRDTQAVLASLSLCVFYFPVTFSCCLQITLVCKIHFVSRNYTLQKAKNL